MIFEDAEFEKTDGNIVYCKYKGVVGVGFTETEAFLHALNRHPEEQEMGKFKDLAITMEEAGMDVRDVLNQRGTRYGQYLDVSSTSQTLKEYMRERPSYDEMEAYMQESLDMVANKLSRILNGDPYYIDSWRDIAGYAQLVVDELEKAQ